MVDDAPAWLSLARPNALKIAIYQPEIPQNTGTLIRLAACLGVGIDIIEPCGFVWSDRQLKRSGLDYHEFANVTRHENWQTFSNQQKRIVLLDTQAMTSYIDFSFMATDTLLVGQESCGIPMSIKNTLPYQVKIPMLPQRRSLNVAIAAALVLGEALRQTKGFPC